MNDGIDIAVNDIPSKLSVINEVVDSIKAMGRKAIAIPGDVTSEEQVKNMVETTARELGSVDIVCLHFSPRCHAHNKYSIKMVANAGIGRSSSFLESE